MNVGIAFHYRGTDIYRMRAFGRTVSRYAGHFPIVIADSLHAPYNRAASRNLAVRLAEAKGWDVVAVHDADMTVPPEAIQKAADLALETGGFIYPYTDYRGLDEHGNKRRHTTDSPGGIFVCTPDTWWSVGGMDEGFTEWGWEDADLRARWRKQGIYEARLPYTAFHYYHEPADPTKHRASWARQRAKA